MRLLDPDPWKLASSSHMRQRMRQFFLGKEETIRLSNRTRQCTVMFISWNQLQFVDNLNNVTLRIWGLHRSKHQHVHGIGHGKGTSGWEHTIWLHLLSAYCLFMHLRLICFKINAPGRFVRGYVKVAGAYPSLHWLESKKPPMTHHQDTRLTQSLIYLWAAWPAPLACVGCGRKPTQHINKRPRIKSVLLYHCAVSFYNFYSWNGR